mmetsp:Transcript_35194/g.113360  ORF Transcript_35194/g.113360 Transcript_35194/m.113360 type:complete len:201 (+) Transcript_35194:1993-2595(+)
MEVFKAKVSGFQLNLLHVQRRNVAVASRAWASLELFELRTHRRLEQHLKCVHQRLMLTKALPAYPLFHFTNQAGHLLWAAHHKQVAAPVVSRTPPPFRVERVGDHCLLENSEVASHCRDVGTLSRPSRPRRSLRAPNWGDGAPGNVIFELKHVINDLIQCYRISGGRCLRGNRIPPNRATAANLCTPGVQCLSLRLLDPI